MDLFISDPTLEFERPKTAAVQLDEDPSMWPKQILQELFRSVPETSEYVPRVVMVKVDKEQGFGLGAVVITSSTDSAMSTTGGGVQSQQALVPVVVKQNMLQPLDLLMTKNKMRPLTGDRLREALFRPSTFELMTKDWGDQSLYNLFYPPGRSENDFASGVSTTSTAGGGTTIHGPGMKYSALLDTIAPTLTQQDLNKLAEEIQTDPALRKQMTENESFRVAVTKLASYDGQLLSSADSLFEKVEAMLPKHVIQVGYDEGQSAYWIKTACRKYAYQVKPKFMDRKAFLKVAGEEVAQKVDTEGTVTVSQQNQAEGPIDVEASEWEVVDKPGIYKVMTEKGKEMMGWVIPNLLDMDGTRLPMVVFTNGTSAMIQDQVVGSRIAEGVNLPDGPPKGTGVFYMAGANGVDATVPVSVVGSEAGMDGAEVYHVKTVMGGEFKLKMVAGLKKFMPDQGDGMVMIPGSAKFMKLDEETQIPLVSEPSALTKTSAHVLSPKIHVYSDGLLYGLRYENLPKLASVYPANNLGYDEATFVLCLAGADPTEAHTALTKASSYRQNTTLIRLHDVRPAREVLDDVVAKGEKTASAVKELRRHLLKEAAVLPDIQTVDTVLSLNFINPENVRMYVSHLPYLDRALSMVCELTLASRLGLNEVPEFAAARACRALNEVIQGLKALALREVDESAAA
jgi:hypothetical protein